MEDSHWYSDETATLGDRIAAAREQAGMTTEQLARRIGVAEASLDSWEQDTNEPRANRLSMLSGVLNVSLAWLLTGEGEGLIAPLDAPLPNNVEAILTDMRVLKAQMDSCSGRLAVLEKQLRHVLKQQAQHEY